MTSGVDALLLAVAAWTLLVLVSTALFWAAITPTRESPLTRLLDAFVLRSTPRQVDSSITAESHQRSPSWRQAAALLVAAGVALVSQWLVVDFALAAPSTSAEARGILLGELVLAGLWIGFLVLQWATARRTT
jgi:hypothetical protein